MRLIPMVELRHRISMLTVIACEGAESDLRQRGIVKKVIRKCNDRFDVGTWRTHYLPAEAQSFVASHLLANMAELQFIAMENENYGSCEAKSKDKNPGRPAEEKPDKSSPDRN